MLRLSNSSSMTDRQTMTEQSNLGQDHDQYFESYEELDVSST